MNQAPDSIPRDLGVFAGENEVFLYSNLFSQQDNSLHLALSRDGLSFKQGQNTPVLQDGKGKSQNTLFFRDFRITKQGGQYILIYRYPSKPSQKIAIATSSDLVSWKKKSDIKGLKEVGVVVPDYMINGKYCMYAGENELRIGLSTTLSTWEFGKNPVLSPRDGSFDNNPLEIGSVHVIDEGILVLYYVKEVKREGMRFSIGAALFDKNDPSRLLWRKNEPLWQQTTEWVGKVVYPLGIVKFQEKLILYFGIEKEGVYAVSFPDFNDLLGFKSSSISPKLKKFDKNPIIQPVLKHMWESQATFNAAAVYDGGKVHFVYRAIGDSNTSVLGYASSNDGFNIDERLKEPIYVPTQPFEVPYGSYPLISFMSGGGYGGCEDPRITKIGDRYYMTYIAHNGASTPRIAMTSIKVSDFLEKKWDWETPKLISSPGVINKNPCLFPEKIDGKFVMLHRIFPNILIDFLDDLRFEDSFLRGDFRIKPRVDAWDSRKVGAGPPPLKTKDGWLLIYHAVDDRHDSQYKMGAMLLDLEDPRKVLYRSNRPILEPNDSYENEGYKSGVAYPCGAVIKDNTLVVYYGGADTYLCAASRDLDEFLTELKVSSPVKTYPKPTLQKIARRYD